MQRYAYVLFDLDGTLLDTSAGLMKSIDYTIRTCGLPALDDERKRGFIGPPIQHSFKAAFDLNDRETAEAAEVFRTVYKETFLLEAYVYPGLDTLLNCLRRQGIRTAVATYKRNDYAQLLVEFFGITRLCDYVLGSDMEGRMSKADIINACLNALGCKNARQALYVGDTEHDAIGASICGMDFAAITFGFGFRTKEEAVGSGAVVALDSLTALHSFLGLSH